LYDEANTLLESDIGKTICSTSLACSLTRRDIWRKRELFKDEGARAQDRIAEGSVRLLLGRIVETINAYLVTGTGWSSFLSLMQRSLLLLRLRMSPLKTTDKSAGKT